MKKETGFSLIELLIVVAIIGIIAAIAIPNLLQARKTANEASAIGALRTVGSAEVTYQGNNQVYGNFTQLKAANLIDQTLVDALGATTSTPKSGYWFGVEAPTATTFGVGAAPRATTSGDRCFAIYEDGVIYFTNSPTTVSIRSAKGSPLGTAASGS